MLVIRKVQLNALVQARTSVFEDTMISHLATVHPDCDELFEAVFRSFHVFAPDRGAE